MPKSDSPIRLREEIAKGWGGASSHAGGLDSMVRKAIFEFNHRLTTDEARAAYADRFIRMTAATMEKSWGMFYEMIRVVRDCELYRKPVFMDEQQAFDSFEDYWSRVVRRPFAVWVELENTYQFAHQYAPELFNASFPDATEARERFEVAKIEERKASERKRQASLALADAKPVLVGEELKGARSEGGHLGGRPKKDIAKNLGTVSTKVNREPRTSSSHITRRLAVHRPDLLELVRSGQLSPHAAGKQAGLIRPTAQIYIDKPSDAVRALVRHFKGDDLESLIRELANWAGLDVVPREKA